MGLRDAFIATLQTELHVAQPRRCNVQLARSTTQHGLQLECNSTPGLPVELRATPHATGVQQQSCMGFREGFEVVAPRAPETPTRRPYRLTDAEADRCHAQPWDDAAIARFVARVGLFVRRGVNATDADDLAERLHLRDLEGGEQAICLECACYRAGRCGSHRSAGLASPELSQDLATLIQRCPSFTAIGN